MNTDVLRSSRWSRATSSCMSRRMSGSRAEKGSSNSRISGSLARARASPTRCCMPPLQLVRVGVAEAAEPDQLEHVAGPIAAGWPCADPAPRARRPRCRARGGAGSRPKCWKTMLIFVAAQLAQPLRAGGGDVLAVDEDLPGGGLDQAGQAAHQRRLARSPTVPSRRTPRRWSRSKEMSRTAATLPVRARARPGGGRPWPSRRSARGGGRRPSRPPGTPGRPPRPGELGRAGPSSPAASSNAAAAAPRASPLAPRPPQSCTRSATGACPCRRRSSAFTAGSTAWRSPMTA